MRLTMYAFQRCTTNEDDRGGAEPASASVSRRADSLIPHSLSFTKQTAVQSGDSRPPSVRESSSTSASSLSPSLGRRRHIPIDISHYVALRSGPATQSTGSNDIYASNDNNGVRVKRHVPIIIPDFAHPFIKELTGKPPFQEIVQSWPVAPKLRRENRNLQVLESSTAAHAHAQDIYDQELKEQESLYGKTGTAMNTSQLSQSVTDSMRNGDTLPEASNPQPATGGVLSPATQQQLDGAGSTNLSGLVCNVHRTTGKEPHALVGATTTILEDKLYVFGGRILSRRKPHLTSDLYELDLIKRHWTRLETFGEIPPPRYFHSVCTLGDTKLVCYGGMSPAGYPKSDSLQPDEPQPEVVVMSDIHIYDVPTRTWKFIATPETPQGRYAHCATILPSSATFTSPTAPFSAIQHNPSSSNPHSGSLGMKIDGAGGAEMVVVGGQDSGNHYIEQISVFNLRSLKWMATSSLGRQCGAYRSVVTPLTGMPVSAIGRVSKNGENDSDTSHETGSSMLIYSNYNFLDVKLELQIRHPDGRLNERFMGGRVSPPGLRFPNGGVIDHHFVVSGTYLTSSKQEYALWALDLRNLTWGRIDAGGSVFGQGSWNRGVLWQRRNTFVILGHRKRSLVEDYNQRRINFSHVCMVELEAFGLYDNPRRAAPSSAHVSASSPAIPLSLWPKVAHQISLRPLSSAAESLGQLALSLKETSDMELLAIGGERIPANSHVLARRWGPYFNRILRESVAGPDGLADALSLRQQMNSQASRNSSITITPSHGQTTTSSSGTTLHPNSTISSSASSKSQTLSLRVEPVTTTQIPPASRPRTLYLPHTPQTLRLMLHYLYTNSLPPTTSLLCTPQILCSVLQLARPYEIDGLLEATVERLHQVLDGRNAAAVFNASAMAAGGGRGVDESASGYHGSRRGSDSGTIDGKLVNGSGLAMNNKVAGLRIDTSAASRIRQGGPRPQGHQRSQSEESAVSTSTTASAATSQSDGEGASQHGDALNGDGLRVGGRSRDDKAVWTGDVSSVVGLQKRGLRGLMEGRRLRERGGSATGTPNPGMAQATPNLTSAAG